MRAVRNLLQAKSAEVQTAGTVMGLKVLCVLIPAVFILGSWAAFKFVWNITPEVRAKMAERKAASAAAKLQATDEPQPEA